jgi:choline dehydrogenase-like flavoprotein
MAATTCLVLVVTCSMDALACFMDALACSSRDISDNSHDVSDNRHDVHAASRDISDNSLDISDSSQDMSAGGHDISADSQEVHAARHDVHPASHDVHAASRDVHAASHDVHVAGHDVHAASRDVHAVSHAIPDSSQDMSAGSRGIHVSPVAAISCEYLKTMERRVDVDVCIVGSGPAGALVASQLAPTGKRIAIVEAGTRVDPEEQGRRLDAGTEPFLIADNDPRLHVPIVLHSNTNWKFFQVRKLGGNTRVWAGWCPRGLENQFRVKSTYGVGEDWPITYDELELFYCQAEQELGVAGDPSPTVPRSQPFPLPAVARDYSSEQFARACSILGYTCHTAPIARATQPFRGREVCRYCNLSLCAACTTTARYKSDFHVDEALAHRGVTLLTETNAARLVVDDDGQIRELLCYLPDRSERTVRAGVFILAGNVFGNARLLLHSAEQSGGRAFERCRKAAGRYFMGHPVYEHHAQLETEVMAARSMSTVVSRHFEDGPHLREAAGFRMFFNASDQTATMHGLRLMTRGVYGTKFKQELRRLAGHGVRATVITDCLPRAENRIALDYEHLDYYGLPGVEFYYAYSDYEENGRRLGGQMMGKILDVLHATKTEEVSYDIAHQLGTTRMGRDPETSVVDADLRLHGIDNVYMAGGSVFPTALGPTNPTLTIAALSLRLANHLRLNS